MKPRVFITRKIPDAGLNRLANHAECDIWTDPLPPPSDILINRSAGCTGVLTLLSDQITTKFFDAVGPQLKVVSNFAVGFNNIDIDEASRRGIAVGNTPDVLTDSTADIAVGLMLAAARRVREGIENVTTNEWRTWEPTGFIGQDLTGRTLGIVGMGRIGLATAQRLHHGWGMQILYTSRSPKPEAEKSVSAQQVSLEELVSQSDFISVHTDLNPQTQHLFEESAFRQMKSTAVFVNTSRGGVVDQDALHHALTTGQIFAAGLDVTEPEPLPSDSPLRHLSNCVILPHIGSATTRSRNAMAEIAADNLIAGIHGQPLRHQVNAT